MNILAKKLQVYNHPQCLPNFTTNYFGLDKFLGQKCLLATLEHRYISDNQTRYISHWLRNTYTFYNMLSGSRGCV